MTKVKSSIAAAAREKARSAKAALDAQREEHDRLVEEATTEYYVAIQEAEDARSEVVAAEERQVQALHRLITAGETNETIVALTGATATTVRAARKGMRVDQNAAQSSTVDKKALATPGDSSTPTQE